MAKKRVDPRLARWQKLRARQLPTRVEGKKWCFPGSACSYRASCIMGLIESSAIDYNCRNTIYCDLYLRRVSSVLCRAGSFVRYGFGEVRAAFGLIFMHLSTLGCPARTIYWAFSGSLLRVLTSLFSIFACYSRTPSSNNIRTCFYHSELNAFTFVSNYFFNH